MSRYIKTQVTQLSANEQAALNNINKNFDDIQSAIQDTVSRSGATPTHMTNDLDMNGKRIINLPAPSSDTDPVRRQDVVGDIALVQNLVNITTNAAAQTLEAAQAVQEIIQDVNVGLVADDLSLDENSKIRICGINIDKITTTANNISNVSSVADNETNINAVNANKTNINKVANDINRVNLVADDISSVHTVAVDISNVIDVADNKTNIDAVAGNETNINTCASNISAITGASTQAANAASSADAAAASAQAAAISAAGSKFKLFHHDWFDYELNDLAWLRADTFSWQDGTAYSDAYNHLVDDYTNGTSTTETVGSYTITYILAEDGHKITTDETTVANIYDESGVAWYYVLDTVNQRFKLPRTKFGFTGLRDTVGKYVPAGLPNITGTLQIAGYGGYYDAYGCVVEASGAFSKGPDKAGSGGAEDRYANLSSKYAYLNASSSNPIYGNSTTVQPPATQMYLYFYVGQFSQTATEQTAGLNSELFNGKLDLDMGNATSSTKQTIVGWVMPNYSAGISIPVPKSSAPYTAPYNGVYKLSYENKSGVSNKYLTVNGVEVYRYQYSSGANPGWLCSIELKKGDVLSANVNDAPTTVFYSVFYPCVGG